MSKYEPDNDDLFMAGYMDDWVDALLSGEVSGIALVAVAKNGDSSYYYMDKASTPVLGVPMNSLHELYKFNREGGTNAPNNNRSHRRH